MTVSTYVAVLGRRSLRDDEVGLGRILPFLELGHLLRTIALFPHVLLLLLPPPVLLHSQLTRSLHGSEPNSRKDIRAVFHSLPEPNRAWLLVVHVFTPGHLLC